MNTVTEQKKSNRESEGKQNKMDIISDALEKCFEIIIGRIEDSWKDFNDQLDIQLGQQAKQKEKVAINKKKQAVKLKVKVNFPNPSKQPQTETPKSPQALQKETEHTSFRTRTRSQNENIPKTQLRSLKKTNELTNQRQEQQKKAQRLKQIAKRKLQLMEKLKKIDAELLEVKREASPNLNRTKDDKSLYQSNLNRSFLAGLSNSRLNRQASQNVVEQHSKAVQMLEKINNQKIKRQERITEEFRRKQQIELMKIQEMEKKRNQELEEKRKRNELAVSKLLRNNNNKSKLVNLAKLNQFNQSNQNSTLPMTMVTKADSETKDMLFFQKKSSKNLLTERDFQNEDQSHAKLFQKAIADQQIKPQSNPIAQEEQKFKQSPQQNPSDLLAHQ